MAGAPWSIPTLPDNPDASRSADAAGRPSNAKRLLLAACVLKCHPRAVTNCGRPRKTWRQGAATRKGCGPLARRKVFFGRPRPDRAAGLAGSRARPGERPGTAETGERPTPDQAFKRLVEGERALHELRCQTPRFPAECEALVGGQILSPESRAVPTERVRHRLDVAVTGVVENSTLAIHISSGRCGSLVTPAAVPILP
jgi:hypothetical protein